MNNTDDQDNTQPISSTPILVEKETILSKIKSWIYNNKFQIIKDIIFILIILALLFFLYNEINSKLKTEEALKKAVSTTEENAKNPNYIANTLGESKKNAEDIAKEVVNAATGKTQPIDYITIQAPSAQDASDEIASRINEKDPTLPPAALDNSDRIMVAPQNENTDYKVGVYKINTYRNWEIGIGAGEINNKAYGTVSVQRNYKKDRAIEVTGFKGENGNTGVIVEHKWGFGTPK